MNTINRLQLRHHTPIFETREAAIEYIYSQIRCADEGLAFEDKSYGFSLLGEPTVLLYKNVTEADPTGENDPHLIFVIGSATNEGTQYNDNRFCIIDIDKTENEIEDLWEELEKTIKSLAIFTKDTNTLKLYSEKTEDGTIISGDVVVATSQIFDDARKPNVILNTDNGLFTYVNMEYADDKLFFTVNGDTKEFPINNYYIVRGYYSKKDESLHLIRKDDVDVVISLENLIDEWGVEGEASNTPIVLTREEVGYGDDSLHNHVEPWQDVLKADVRLADRRYNILKKTSDGRYLYVDGLANNITFFKDGEEMTVQEALANAAKGVSNDSTNIIYEKADGCYATAALKYFNKENKLVFTTSNVTGGTTIEEIKLNSVEAFKKIVYDPVTETLIIMYVDGNGDIQECNVPIGQMMQDWEWDIVNDGHNVKLHKQRVIAGNDKVSADAAIYDDPDNILVDKNHELFVKGTADNIRYDRDGNVSDELDKLNANDADINARLNETSGKVDTLRVEFDAEVERATSEEQRIEDKLNNEITRSNEKDAEHDSKISTIEQTIGDGFSIDGHETITYKFNELSSKTSTISAKTETIDANLGLLSAKTEAEIVRAKSEEQRIEKKFDDAFGDGFDIRNTVRDEFDREKSERVGEDSRLQVEIDALSANTEGRLMDVINIDHSIDVDKTNLVKPVISVNLSEEKIEGMPNVIKLNNDGLYAGVDLDYYFESGTSKNVLVFKTTNGTKTFDLKSNSVVDKIYYDPAREAIIIEYTVDGHRMPDVVVPVGDIINEWRIWDGHEGAVQLEKQRIASGTSEQDVLKASVVISETHDDNIIINDNGALYVSGAQIEQNKADISTLGERMDAAEADIDALDDGLAAEITRSTTEDDNLWEALRAEIARSTEKDNEHDAEFNEFRTDLTNEIANRTNGDLRLEGLIHTEEDRAKTAESAITHALDAEILNRQNGDNTLNQKIDNEISSARTEEHRIEARLNEEIARSTNKDSELETTINNVVTAHTSNTTIHITSAERTAWNAKADASDIPSVSGYADSVKYNSTTKYVEFYHGTTAGTKVFEYDASPFLIDGMVQNVEIKDVQSGDPAVTVTCLVVSFNTDAGKQDINIPISQIFDANNYYTTAQTSGATELQTAFNGKADTATMTALNNVVTAHTANTNIHLTTTEKGQLHTHTNKTYLDGITGTVGTMAYENVNSYSSATQVSTALVDKVDKTEYATFSAATSTSIEDLSGKSETVATALEDLNTRKLDASAYTPTDLSNYYTKSETSGATELQTALFNKADKTAVDDLSGQSKTIAAALNDLESRKMDASAYTPTDLSNYYQKSETSGATEIQTALSNKADKTAVDDLSGQSKTIAAALNDLNTRKLDASAYTPTDLSNYYTKSETSGATEIQTALSNKADKTAVDDLSGQSKTIAAALNDLNNRIYQLEEQLRNLNNN